MNAASQTGIRAAAELKIPTVLGRLAWPILANRR